MARTPRPHRPALGDGPASHVIDGEPPVEVYPLERGGRAVPDRSRPPRIGAACYHTDRVPAPPTLTDELREGVELRSTRGNNEPVPKTTQEFGDDRREARGVRVRPLRPGQHA
jgi:hypothetical protein